MKTLKNLTIAALLGVVVFTGCKKYEEGPALSLRSKKARLAGEWVQETSMYDGVTNPTVSTDVWKIEKDGKFTVTSSTGTMSGEWEFINDKEDLQISYTVGTVTVKDTTHIIRLTNKEFWTKDTYMGHTSENHMKAK